MGVTGSMPSLSGERESSQQPWRSHPTCPASKTWVAGACTAPLCWGKPCSAAPPVSSQASCQVEKCGAGLQHCQGPIVSLLCPYGAMPQHAGLGNRQSLMAVGQWPHTSTAVHLKCCSALQPLPVSGSSGHSAKDLHAKGGGPAALAGMRGASSTGSIHT